jgi:hypothetical protein
MDSVEQSYPWQTLLYNHMVSRNGLIGPSSPRAPPRNPTTGPARATTRPPRATSRLPNSQKTRVQKSSTSRTVLPTTSDITLPGRSIYVDPGANTDTGRVHIDTKMDALDRKAGDVILNQNPEAEVGTVKSTTKSDDTECDTNTTLPGDDLNQSNNSTDGHGLHTHAESGDLIGRSDNESESESTSKRGPIPRIRGIIQAPVEEDMPIFVPDADHPEYSFQTKHGPLSHEKPAGNVTC